MKRWICTWTFLSLSEPTAEVRALREFFHGASNQLFFMDHAGRVTRTYLFQARPRCSASERLARCQIKPNQLCHYNHPIISETDTYRAPHKFRPPSIVAKIRHIAFVPTQDAIRSCAWRLACPMLTSSLRALQ
ncbi:hypothetical protein BS50DRAFT_108766 [Corynespora cassiicola Philippines]|uniref:Uncharacterized protein n=1 Tax=Corynespora cassiicola Philippines TaxID=1448308 RepID=A0A2T2NCW5_CORCC|nr:hypothetical protein BS50DRAFT_108766 [Corynespora cassiicola Philippines]